jgi:hypothetical protein
LVCLIISKTVRFKEKWIKLFSLQLLLETFFTLVDIYQVTLKIFAETHVKLWLKLLYLNENWDGSTVFLWNSPVWNFMKILSTVLELFHEHRQMDWTNSAGLWMHLRKKSLLSTKLYNVHMDVREYIVYENKFLWKMLWLRAIKYIGHGDK